MTMGQIVQIVTCVCAVTGGLKMAGCDRLWRAGNYKRQGGSERQKVTEGQWRLGSDNMTVEDRE